MASYGRIDVRGVRVGVGDGLLARYKHCHQRGHIFIWKACLNGKKMASGRAKNFVVDPERSETK